MHCFWLGLLITHFMNLCFNFHTCAHDRWPTQLGVTIVESPVLLYSMFKASSVHSSKFAFFVAKLSYTLQQCSQPRMCLTHSTHKLKFIKKNIVFHRCMPTPTAIASPLFIFTANAKETHTLAWQCKNAGEAKFDKRVAESWRKPLSVTGMLRINFSSSQILLLNVKLAKILFWNSETLSFFCDVKRGNLFNDVQLSVMVVPGSIWTSVKVKLSQLNTINVPSPELLGRVQSSPDAFSQHLESRFKVQTSLQLLKFSWNWSLLGWTVQEAAAGPVWPVTHHGSSSPNLGWTRSNWPITKFTRTSFHSKFNEVLLTIEKENSKKQGILNDKSLQPQIIILLSRNALHTFSIMRGPMSEIRFWPQKHTS